MSYRKALTVFAALLFACVSGAQAGRIPGGCDLDGNNHPSVSVILGQMSDPGTCSAEVISGCHAVLVSPTVAVTTAECASVWATGGGFPLTATWLAHDPNDVLGCTGADRIASYHVHPAFDPAVPISPFNIGVIVLAAPSAQAFASLPAAGAVDLLMRGDPLVAVGYADPGPGGTFVRSERRFTTADLFKKNDFSLTLKVTGKTCLPSLDGSGVFAPGGQGLLAIALPAFGDRLRLDIPEVRDFLDDFVTVP